MNHIHPAQERNPETTGIHGKSLEAAEFIDISPTRCGQQAPLDDFVNPAGSAQHAGDIASGKVQLADFFFKGHLAHQVGDEGIHFLISRLSCTILCASRNQDGACENNPFHPYQI